MSRLVHVEENKNTYPDLDGLSQYFRFISQEQYMSIKRQSGIMLLIKQILIGEQIM